MKIKICGMRDPKNVKEAIGADVDMVGFIFYPGSKRYVRNIPPIETTSVKRVGVFVNEREDRIREIAHNWSLDLIQLHGDEKPEDCLKLKSLGLPLVKAFQVDEHFDFGQLEPYAKVVQFFLFDTKGQNYGGTGKTFDWNILHNYKLEVPFWLSGGISPDMAIEIKKLNFPNLIAVDLNSRFEIEPGLKNIEKLKSFVDELHS